MMIRRRTILLGIAGACVAGVATAQTLPFIGGDQGPFGGGQSLLGDAGGLSDSDAFRASMLQDGSYSIQASNIALSRPRSPHVLEFAQLELNEQVSLAAALGTSATNLVPLRPDQAERLAELQSASRRDFDRLYIVDQVAAHNEALSVATPYAQAGDVLAERRVAILAVPTIQTHLVLLHRLLKRVE